MISKFKLFLENLIFDFNKDDWDELDKIKIDTLQRRGEFLDYEIDYFATLGLYPVGEDNMRVQERTPYYYIQITKRVNFSDKSYDRRKDPFVFNYYCYLMNPQGYSIHNLNTGSIKPEATKEERIRAIKKMMKELYLVMWERKIDPETIKKKEKVNSAARLKHKEDDPYGEEKWEDEN